MQSQNPASFIAHEAILAGSRVVIRTDLKVELADDGVLEDGVALLFNGKSSYAEGESVGVRLRRPSITMVAAGAFAAGASVQRADDGKVDDSGTGTVFGIAAEAAAADLDLVEVYPREGGASGVIPADIATIDAIDLATTTALANENKAKINALLAALR